MKLHVWPLAGAVGIVTAVLFAICAFFVAVAPETTIAFFSYLLHVDLTGLARPITWAGFFAGLLGVGLGMALAAGAAAWLYNRIASA